jgi:YHS domain-containing protein
MQFRGGIVVMTVISLLVAGVVGLGPNSAYAAQPAIYTGLVRGVAVGGYDPVSYFAEGKAVTGNAAITLEHEGATWRFASEANREVFAADPDKYAPRYGGYCAYAVAMGYTAKGDPKAWSIVDGRLYLNFNLPTRKEWEKDTAGYIAKANKNWPGVLQK